jgi:hypothetical protein
MPTMIASPMPAPSYTNTHFHQAAPPSRSSSSTPLSISPPHRSYAAPPRRSSALWAPLTPAASQFVEDIIKTAGPSRKVEFVIDVPVWSPGMWTDLSALSQLRDQTLAMTHSVIHHLSIQPQPIQASYRLLARSCTSPACTPSTLGQRPKHPHLGMPCPQSGWGCIRLLDGGAKASRRNPSRRSSIDALSAVPAPPSAASDEDDEENEETVEDVVKRYVEERNAKGENGAFAIQLFGAPALVLVEV